jgi:hypothetical protein
MTIIELTEEQARLFRDVPLPARLVDSQGRFVGLLEPVSEKNAEAVEAILRARRDEKPLNQ